MTIKFHSNSSSIQKVASFAYDNETIFLPLFLHSLAIRGEQCMPALRGSILQDPILQDKQLDDSDVNLLYSRDSSHLNLMEPLKPPVPVLRSYVPAS